MKTRIFRSISAMALSVLFFACKTQQVSVNQEKSENQQGFVKVKGTNFMVDGKPYYYVGTNFWYGAYLGADANYGDRERLLRELDHLQKLGINNLRITAASEESDFGLPLSPPFQYKNGEYNETLFQGLDFLLAEMGKRNLRAVLVLNNFWDWSGGMAEYVSWATGEKVIDPSVDKSVTWNQAIDFSARFYKIEAAQKLYRKYINTIVNRKNTVTKKIYKNDSAIMAWQLANEPRPLQDNYKNIEENIKVFANWVDQTAAYIHSIDPNHLVSTGSEGSKGSLNKLEYAKQIHQSKNIDYTTFHLWPKNWGWYKADNPDMESTKKLATEYIDEHIEMSGQLNKPSVLEEIGFVRDGETFSPETPVRARNEFFGFILNKLQESIKEGNSLKGLNFWGWGGEGRAQQPDYMWKPNDVISYTADPYSEAQGLNSIYDTDASTLELISKVAHELENMSSKPMKTQK